MDGTFALASLEIKNFRGVDSLECKLPFMSPLHLIGSNNSSKSTVLDAFALVLRGGGTHAFTVSEYDFHRKTDQSSASAFTISLRFSASDNVHLPAVQGMGNPIPVHGLKVTGTRDKNGNLKHQHLLFDKDEKTITFSQRTPLKGQAKEDYGDRGLGWRPVYARLDDIRDILPEVWLLRPDNLRASLYQWKTGPLQRLSKMLAERFLETEWTLELDGKTREMPETMVNAHAFFRDAVTAFPFWKDDLKPKLQETLSSYIGRDARIDLRLDIRQLEDWLAQQLAVAFAGEAGTATTPLDRMGDGWQSLVRLAALEVLSKYPEQLRDRVVLLFEEPETYLHPHLVRKLRDILSRLSKHWTVVTATHAPEMISFNSDQTVVRLWRTTAGVRKGHIDTGNAASHVRFQERVDERGGQEMLFSQRTILCEGKDDVFVIKDYLRRSNVDLDGKSVSVINCGDVGAIPTYAEMAKSLGIPWCAITDEDRTSDGSVKKNTQIARDKLANLTSTQDKSLVWAVDLEHCLSITSGKASPEKCEAKMVSKAASDLEKDYPLFAAVAKEVLAWILLATADGVAASNERSP